MSATLGLISVDDMKFNCTNSLIVKGAATGSWPKYMKRAPNINPVKSFNPGTTQGPLIFGDTAGSGALGGVIRGSNSRDSS